MADLVLKGGRVVTPEGVVSGGLAIENGVIVNIGPDRSLPAGSHTIDLAGRVVLPGLIDPHVHLGVGGSADIPKLLSDMEKETSAAALGGITTIVTDHENASGPSWVTTLLDEDGETLLDRAKRECAARSPIDFRFTANPDKDEHLDEIPALVEQGVTSFKMFPSYVGDEADAFGISTVEYEFIFRAFERIAAAESEDRPTQGMVHCEEPTICGMLKQRYRDEGRTGLEWWTRARPAACEAMQIFDIGMIALETRGRAYIPHVSSDEGAHTIEYLRTRGVRIVGETCPHYLLSDIPWSLGAWGKLNPPLRGPQDASGLWDAIDRGVIDVMGSDNCRYALAEKEEHDLWEAIPGISEIGATLPLLLTEGIATGRLDWTALARITAERAARSFGMYPRKGVLSVGSDGDLVVVDPEERWTLGTDVPLSGADWSIYEGREVVGRPVLTVSRGRVIAERGAVLERGGGTYIAAGGAAVPS
jgi:dihydroorotase-like cyclic amidohydrolase